MITCVCGCKVIKRKSNIKPLKIHFNHKSPKNASEKTKYNNKTVKNIHFDIDICDLDYKMKLKIIIFALWNQNYR